MPTLDGSTPAWGFGPIWDPGNPVNSDASPFSSEKLDALGTTLSALLDGLWDHNPGTEAWNAVGDWWGGKDWIGLLKRYAVLAALVGILLLVLYVGVKLLKR